jgi:hypothetical protein
MLTFALALMAAAPMAVQATGMEPQLRIIREQAAKRNWPITCVGHSGEEGVLRIGVPAGTSSEAVDAFEEAIKSVASSWGNLGADATKATCDAEPIRVQGSGEMRTLIFTAGERDPRLLILARQCGFWLAYWRPTTPEDLARFGGRISLEKARNTLDAGENIITRYGPMMCFLNMHRLVQGAAAKGASPKGDNSH